MTKTRFFEILPGALAWATIMGMFVFSYLTPVAVAIFIILFDTYWFLKSMYLSLHLRATYAQMKKNLLLSWHEKLVTDPETRARWSNIYHLVILPMYNESFEVVSSGLETIAQSTYPKEKILIVLALEERAGETAQEIGQKITDRYGRIFGGFLVTTHPKDQDGEIPGKGSNEAYAAQIACVKLVSERHIDYKNVLVSVFDVDTQVFPDYFSRLTHSFLTVTDPMRCIYQPVPLFTNNIFEAPALARVIAFSCTFWQMMQQSRPERLTSFSSQSIPLQTLHETGYWQRNVVSEDSRIFWQCYLQYDGNFRVEPLAFPISMDANLAETFWGTMKNLYKQQRRWGWGAENIPYMLNGFLENKKIPAHKKRFWTFNALEGFHSWATNSLMIFALGWLPLFLGGEAFKHTLLSYSLPRITRFIVTLSMIGVAASAAMGIVLLPTKKPQWFSWYHYVVYAAQWALIPISLIIFGSIPGLDAQTRLALGGKWRLGFWVTPKARKVDGKVVV